MNKIQSTIHAISKTWWFLKTSWDYIITKECSSYLEYFVGVIPARYKFMIVTYRDFRLDGKA